MDDIDPCAPEWDICVLVDETAEPHEWYWRLKRNGRTEAESRRFVAEWDCRDSAEWLRRSAARFRLGPPAF